jgi:hypothetical protein
MYQLLPWYKVNIENCQPEGGCFPQGNWSKGWQLDVHLIWGLYYKVNTWHTCSTGIRNLFFKKIYCRQHFFTKHIHCPYKLKSNNIYRYNLHSLVLIYKNRHTFVHVQVRQIAVAMVMSTFILFWSHMEKKNALPWHIKKNNQIK